MVSLSQKICVSILRIIKGKSIIGKALGKDAAPRAKPNPFLPTHRRFKRRDFQGCAVWEHDHFHDGSGDKPIIYYLHGGAYVLGMQAVYFTVLDKLARASKCKVIAPCYPLPPKDNVHSITAFARDHFNAICAKYGAENIVIAGDSAGANLALVTLTARRDAGLPQPRRAVLWCPLTDQSLSRPDMTAHREEQLLDADILRAAGRRYAADLDVSDPRVSPFYADLSDLAPITLFSGDRDLLHADILAFEDKLRKAGNAGEIIIGEGLPHDWMILPTPEAKAAISQTARFILAP